MENRRQLTSVNESNITSAPSVPRELNTDYFFAYEYKFLLLCKTIIHVDTPQWE